MTIEQMREKLLTRYTGSKRIASMPDKQIYALYTRLLDKGDI